MQPPFDIAADLDTPVSAYLKLAPFGPRFLLESVEGGERLGRYSFIGFGDGTGLSLEGGRLTAGPEVAPAPREKGVLLDAFRRALARAPRLRPEIPGLSFQGGLVGVAGYDLARRMGRHAPPPHEAGLPEAAFFAPRSLLVFDHVTRRVAFLHDGEERERLALRREVVTALRGKFPDRPRRGVFAAPVASLGPAAFVDVVRRARDRIFAGDVYQIVPSVRFSGACDLDPFEVYRALRLLNPSPYMYFCDFGGVAVAGSSPEALVRLEGRRAELRPIAGTRPRSADAEEDARLERELCADPKEGSEHVMLVDLARNDLGRLAVTGSVEVGAYRQVERYSHVMHMVSAVRGVLRADADAFDLFADTFPAGTVVGAPKKSAMALLDELEPSPRGFYAGAVGYFGHGGTMDLAIAIRTLVFREGIYAYQAGAGIVAESVARQEHAEVLAKGAALGAALDLAKEGL